MLIILGTVIRWKCFNHTMGTFCFKEDIQNQEDVNVNMDLKYQNNTERYKINFDNERNMRPDEGKIIIYLTRFIDIDLNGLINNFRVNKLFFLLRLYEIKLQWI